MSNNKASVTSTGEIIQAVSYNPNKPYDFEYVPQNVQPTDFPRMSGVIKLTTGRLVAVDQQGNYMLDVSQADCQRWLDGYRPFNYFANNNQDSRNNAQLRDTANNTPTDQSDIQQAAQMEQAQIEGLI